MGEHLCQSGEKATESMGAKMVTAACCTEPAPYGNASRQDDIRCMLAHSGLDAHSKTGRSGFVFIANGGNHDIKMYDVSEEEDMHTFHGHRDSVTDIHIIHGPFAMQLLTSSLDRTVRVWDIKTAVQQELYQCQSAVTAVRGLQSYIFAATQDEHHLINMWQSGQTEVAFIFSGHEGAIKGLECMTVGDKQDIQLISYSADCNVRVWSVAERVCLFNLHHPEEVSSVLLLERSVIVVTAGVWLLAWDLLNCSEPLFQTRSEHHRMITNACLHQKESSPTAGCTSNRYKIYTGDCNADIFEWKLDLNPTAKHPGFSVKRDRLRMPKGDPSSGGIVAMTCLEDWLFAAVDKVLEQWDLSMKPRSRI